MRISDWSSDVCSSDLDIFAIVAALGPICGKQRQYASLTATIDPKQAAPLANALFPSEIAAPASNVFFLSRQGIGDQVIDPEDETGFVDENALEHTVLSEFRIIGGKINFPHIIGRETQRSSHRLRIDAVRTLAGQIGREQV